MVGNGKTEAASMYGSSKGQMIDKKWREVGRATYQQSNLICVAYPG